MDGMLLQSVEAFEESPESCTGEMWEMLQAEKERICHEIVAEDQARRDDASFPEVIEAPDELSRQIKCHQRETLESRLRAVVDAQDRLIDGGYGICLECGREIEPRRLSTNPAVARCVNCQVLVEREVPAYSL